MGVVTASSKRGGHNLPPTIGPGADGKAQKLFCGTLQRGSSKRVQDDRGHYTFVSVGDGQRVHP